MKFETIVKQLEKGINPKIYFVDTYDPFLFTGYAKRALIDTCRRVDLRPFVGLNVEHSKHDSGLFSKCISDDSYSGLLAESKENPGSIVITTSYEQHRQQALKLVKKICGRETKKFKEYLTLAKRL